MARNPSPHRRSIRLKGYDYTQPGTYFVTIVTQGRRHLFGEVADGKILLNDAGQMVNDVWMDLPKHYPGVELDAFVIMPNHIHGIIILVGAGPRACPDTGQPQKMGQPQGVAPTLGLPDIVIGSKP
jgi:putative transposase